MVAGQYRVIDYLEDNRKAIDYYVRQIQSKPYVYERHFCHMTVIMPTSLQVKQCANCRGYGLKVEITPQIGIDNGINATRMAMANCWIDEQKCKEGIKALEYYHYEQDKTAIAKHSCSRLVKSWL